MKKNRLYRIGAGLLAGLLVFTGVPQNISFAQEAANPDENSVSMEIQTDNLSDGEDDSLADSIMPSANLADDTDLKNGGDAQEQAAQSAEAKDTQDDELRAVDPQADDPQPVPKPVTGIKLKLDKLTLMRNDTAQLEYTLEPADANEGKNVTFKSSNEDIATVSATGLVLGVKKGGPVFITAETENGFRATCEVTVNPIPVETVTISPEETLKLTEGGSAGTLTVSVNPEDADERGISVSSTNEKVATVTSQYNATTKKYDLTVTPVSGGVTEIRAVSMDQSNRKAFAVRTVEVEAAPIKITGLKPETAKVSMYQNQTMTLHVLYEPAYTTQTGVTWAVTGGNKWDYNGDGTEEECVTVDEKGQVRCRYPLPAAVTTKDVTITATSTVDTSKVATFTVTIKKPNIPASSLTVLTKELILEDGGANQTGIVEVRVEPTATTDTEVTATIDDGTVAEFVTAGAAGSTTPVTAAKAVIDNKGTAQFKIKGMKPGSCDITFQVGTNNLKASFPVTVNEYVAPVDSVGLSDTVLTITEQREGTLTAEIKPLEAENRYIDWSVSNPEIATIKDLNETGGRTTATKTGTAPNEKLTSTVTIEAHMIGECVITATAAGDISKTCKIKVTADVANPVTGLTIKTEADSGLGDNPAIIYIRQGQSLTFTPAVTPAGANPKVRWSSNSSVASVSVGEDSVCTVTADQTGTCIVTAQASGSDSACKKEIEIIVRRPRLSVESPEDFSFEPDMLPITEDKVKEKLSVKFYPYEKPLLTEDAIDLAGEQYRLQIVAEDGTSLRPYAPEDMEKAGTKILVVSYDYGTQRIEYPNHIPVTMKEFSEAQLVSVAPLSGEAVDIWNVPNGTPLSELPLVKTTEITIKGIKSQIEAKADAEIEWNVSAANYNPNLETAQEFVVYGTVKLPAYVKGTVSGEDIPLDVSARVHVREKATSGKQVEAPKFSVLGGEKIGNTAVEVPYGSKIVIESATEEAVIYYMLDRRPDAERKIPQDEEHRYKRPLELEAMTTTIYAIAVKEGYTDSNCSECTVKLVRNEPDIPEDPDDPEPDHVTDEDRPADGKVPNGLWVAVQPDDQGRKDNFPYTGSAIKPVIHVYDHTTLLQEKRDYTITYKNNTKAGEKGSANAPSIIVKGKGNYSGQTSVSFTITPQSIEDDTVVMEEYVAVAYNKKEQKPNPSLIWKGKKLTKGKDFTVSDNVYREPKQYSVTVTGIGNFTGTKKMTYEIFDGGVAVSKLTVSKIPDQKCTGQAITPPVVVKYKKTVLREGANYTVQYRNNVEVGTASVIITGRGGYKGTKRIDFKIKAMAKISEAGFTMTFDPATPVYNGAPIKPVSYKAVYQSEELKEGVDYKVSYANNDKAGTASLILTGMGRFSGTAKKTYKIQPGDLSKVTNVVLKAEYPYEKGGCKPKPEVYSGNYKLLEGKDYTLSYTNHKAAGKIASVTIKGKGSFKGSIVKQFAVARQNIENLQVVAADKTYRNKANSYRTSVKVIDVNGKALTAGTDYDKEMYYTYADGPNQGEQVLPTDIIPRGTNLRVEVRVTNPKNYIGTAHGVYRIVQADISKAKVKVDEQEYTGRKRKPGKDQIHVTVNGVALGNSDFEIVGYENNVNQGTAKVTIRGVGSYGGTKTANFKIRKRGLLNLTF